MDSNTYKKWANEEARKLEALEEDGAAVFYCGERLTEDERAALPASGWRGGRARYERLEETADSNSEAAEGFHMLTQWLRGMLREQAAA